ncbi:MAG TPA: hypothetical protein VIL38_00850 [Thermaerobacter sp.]
MARGWRQPEGDGPAPAAEPARRRLLRWFVPAGAGLALAALSALAVALWPGPFHRAALGRVLAVEVVLVLLAALNYSGFLWGRRTFTELVTAQPQPPPEELARRDVLFLQLIVAGAVLFAVWLLVGG